MNSTADTFQEAKDAVDKVTAVRPGLSKLDKKDINIISVSHQGNNSVTPVLPEDDTAKTSALYQHHDNTNITSLSLSYQHHITISLSARQQEIYEHLLSRGINGSFTKTDIQKLTKIPYITIRDCLRKLKNANVIKLIYDTCQKRTFYEINSSINVKTYKPQNITDTSISHQYHYHDTIISSLSHQNPLINSSNSFINKKLTTDSEFFYWKQKGLTVKQIESWIEEFGCTPETMTESLCHCRFDMVDMDVEKTKPVDNPINWFYKIMQKTGYYPKPKNYKSFQEKEIERNLARIVEEKALKEKALEIEKTTELKTEFEKMMADPEGDLFKKCRDMQNAFIKKRIGEKGFGNEMVKNAMERALENILFGQGDD